jgi:hypothetical protein
MQALYALELSCSGKRYKEHPVFYKSGFHLRFFFMAQQPLVGQGLLIIKTSHTTLGRTPLDEWLAGRRDLYLTTHNTHMRQTSMPSAGFEPKIPRSERLQIHALDCTATGIGFEVITVYKYMKNVTILRGTTKILYQSHIATHFHFILILFYKFLLLRDRKNGKIGYLCNSLQYNPLFV